MAAANKPDAGTKRVRISDAQKYMLICVLGAALILGGTLAALAHFVQEISFNGKILAKQDEAISHYSEAIKTTGICRSPKDGNYSDDELDKCNPSSIDISQIPNTLRSNVLTTLASDDALNSVPKEASSICVNNRTGRNYTYSELKYLYDDAVEKNNADSLATATTLMKSCSALRVIPDALPSYKNEEALLASLNKLFIDSNWQPESLSPGGNATTTGLNKGLNALSVRVGVEADSGTTMRVLLNIERSIREFNIERATIEWSGADTLSLQANATAYYMDSSVINEKTETVKPGGDK